MTPDEIYAKVQSIISTYLPEDVDASNINKDSDLTGELNINSAHLVDVILDVEDEFNIELSNSDIEEMRTVNDAIQIISKKLE